MTISADQLVEQATARTGLHDFGGDHWREGLVRLVDSLNQAGFAPDVETSSAEELVTALAARLEIEDWIARHPEVEAEPIERPVIIMGLPRTASTALQNNLASDPHWRFLRGWEAARPVPPPVLGEEGSDPRYLKEKAFVDQDETFKGKHIQTAGGPVEDSLLQRLNWGGPEQGFPAFSYTRWWRDQSQVETLTYQKRVMRLLQSRRPPRRWMLKSPWYCFHLDDLRRVFPDVRLVMTHRHPGKIIPSLASLLYTRYRLYLPESAIDKPAIGRWCLDHWSNGIARGMEFRERHPEVEIYDVHHAAFNADPLGVLKNLYGWLGEEMSAEGEEEMRAWSERHRRGTHGEHRYTPEEYGLSEAAIEEAFGDYIAAHCREG